MPHPRIRRSTAGRDAIQGAVAGLIGGAALIVAQRALIPRLAGSHARVRTVWDDRFEDAVERMGMRVPRRSRAALSIGSQLAYAALLGASYAIARRSLRHSPAGQKLLDAGLMFGASLFSAEAPRVRRRGVGARERAVRQARERVVGALSAPAIYHRMTAMALARMDR